MLLLLLVFAGIVLGIEYLKNPKFRLGAGFGVFITFLAIGILLPKHFVFQKVAGRLAMPTGILWLGLFAMMFADLRTMKWRRSALSLMVFMGYWTTGSPIIGSKLIRHLENQLRIPSDADTTPLDAICILGGGTQLSPQGQPELGPSGDRVRLAAELWHKQRAPVLVASGYSPRPFGLGNLAAHTKELLEGLGIPPQHIAQLPYPVNTTEEMTAFSQLASDRGWQRVGLISSAWHLPRAMNHAHQSSVEFIPIPADHRVGPLGPIDALALIPSPNGFTLVHIWAWETLGMLVGR